MLFMFPHWLPRLFPVLEDADVDSVFKLLMRGVFQNCVSSGILGVVCAATKVGSQTAQPLF